jgi:hypothetical protein
VTDAIKLGKFTVNAGFRFDQYNGLSSSRGIQPRLGIAYRASLKWQAGFRCVR